MRIHVVTRSGYEKIYWGERYILGITDEAKARGDELVFLSPDELYAADSADIGHPIGNPILLSSSRRWITSVLGRCPAVTPILLTEPPFRDRRASCVTFDYAGGVRGLLDGFGANSCTALVSCNADSLNDLAKKREFVRITGDESAVYYHHRSIGDRIFDDFLRDIDRYDSVICTNDIVLMLLRRQLAARGIDQSGIVFATFGDRQLTSEDEVRYAFTDYAELGREAVSCAHLLSRGGIKRSVDVRLECRCGEFTPSELRGRSEPPEQTEYLEENALFVQKIKYLLGGADRTDIELLRLSLDGLSYEEIAERIYMSVNSLKRRMKAMVDASDCASKVELCEMLRQYL